MTAAAAVSVSVSVSVSVRAGGGGGGDSGDGGGGDVGGGVGCGCTRGYVHAVARNCTERYAMRAKGAERKIGGDERIARFIARGRYGVLDGLNLVA